MKNESRMIQSKESKRYPIMIQCEETKIKCDTYNNSRRHVGFFWKEPILILSLITMRHLIMIHNGETKSEIWNLRGSEINEKLRESRQWFKTGRLWKIQE